MAIYSTANQEGVDVNAVFALDTSTPEYPAPPFLPGTPAYGTDGSAWIYATASITIASGSAVIFSETTGTWSVALLSNTQKANFGQLVGVVAGSTGTMVIPAPSGKQTGMYFWVQRAGICPALVSATTIAANVLLHTSVTGGALGITGGTGTSAQVAGVVFATAIATAGQVKPAVLNFPTISTAD